MRYIVRSDTGEFGGVRVLAESTNEAIRIANEMIEREAPNVSIIDTDGSVFGVDELRLVVTTEAAEPAEKSVA